ncbi:hypothetical protein AXK12_00525 [Cephaloticoccus capnophilus]|uniref:Glycosyltransferase RgtA/B/C/D-like domain-containing protein n=1 Tax=Cephaloticoccus capnophilus TaxID=1548208 RepID=A0A139SIQ9_9BACT|nr:hypothetical protein [Cephaloticoccus capnophilus]KXU34429.1 hypothetical protein AXK12_00525 [Cephaloticoccus capnophilus]
MMKLSKEGDLGLFTHVTTESLGAPFTGQLNDFPQTERVIVWLGGQVARVIGLMPAANAMLILSCIVAAFSFYAAARFWKISRLSSWAFAVVYAFLPHNQRSLDSLGVIATGLLPLQFYCLWYIATVQNVSWGSFRFRLTLAIGLLSGLLNIYWVFFFLNLYVLALLCRILKGRKNSIASLAPIITTCLIVGALLGSYIVYRMSYGENPAALVRSYGDVDRESLKPIELFIPRWGTHLEMFAGFFSRYYDGGKMDIGEEWWGIYIGLLPMAGLLFLFLKGIQRQVNKRAPSLPFLAGCWIIAYSSFGGINAIFSLILNFYDIRGTNRYFVAIATIGLIYFAFVINRLMRNCSFATKLSALGGLALLAMMDQSFHNYFHPRYNIPTRVIKERVMADRDLALRLEDSLEAGAMIYILPVLDFPEPFEGRGAYKINFFIYDPIRPFLYSTKLRYSYGSNKGRQGADWQLDVQELPPKEMAATLESFGFSGILFNRKDYADGGEKFLTELGEAGWPMEFEQGIGNEWVFIRLTPAARPALPTLTPYALASRK